MSKKKYLSKSDFFYDTSPNVRRSDGKGHVVYRSAVHKKKSKVNVITHSATFYSEPTHPFIRNPQIGSKNKKTSRYSVPRWEDTKYLKSPKGNWRISPADKKAIKKFNAKYK